MRRLPTMMLTLTMAAGLAACGGSSSSSPSSSGGGGSTAPSAEPTTGSGATAAITTLYNNFFGASEPQAMAMLQDGSTLSKAFKVADKLKGSTVESSKTLSVKLTGPTTANVTFELDGDGKPVIAKSNGQAVYVNGKWLVAKQTFCSLVELGGDTNIPGCS